VIGMATWSTEPAASRGAGGGPRVALAPGAARAAGGDRVEIWECPFDRVTMDEAVERVLAWCRGERRTRVVMTMNVHHMVEMRRDPEFAQACRASDLVIADGMPVVWASHVAGVPLPGRLTGCDLMPRLLAAAAAHALPVYFLGARDEIVQALVDDSVRRYPGLRVAGFRNGYFRPEESDAVIAEIRRSGAAMLFVGMPSPFKDVWCERHRDAFGASMILGVGGTFDVLAGLTPRAPAWMQHTGLEWLWRVAMEPRRLFWRHFRVNSLFLARLGVEVAKRIARGRPAARPQGEG
jgi:N-acetylglucosaminyldiphosphoundecaprenol N-acetyl-beta-D-mannosaminyltransferase